MSTNINNLKKKIASNDNNINVAAAIIVIVVMVLLYGFSWIVTCGIIKLITMDFGLTFKWSIATGIWLVLSLLYIYIYFNLLKNQTNTKNKHYWSHKCKANLIQ